MGTFDIFVKGINPDRIEESEQIKKQLADAFQISLADVDELLALPNGACIRRELTEEQAIEYQRALTKLGLVVLYLPAKKQAILELEPIEEELIATSVSCPNCDNTMLIEEDTISPEKCDSCGIDIAKFLAQKDAQAEREAIKAKLLASQNIQKTLEEKRQQEETQRQRKAELEKQVLEEMGIQVREKKPINKKLLAAGVSSIGLAIGASYLFSSSTPQIAMQTVNATPVLASENEANPSTQQTLETSSANAPLNAQQSMQKTHDQAAQVLNGFGLDPDAFANAGANSSSPSVAVNSQPNAAIQNTIPTANTAAAPVTKQSATTALAQNTTQQKQIVQQTDLINAELLQVTIENDVTWDKFLAQNTKTLFERKLPEKGLQLMQFIVAHDVYVGVIGEQIAIALKEKQMQSVESYLSVLETRLIRLPSNEQAVYFAQASVYLPLENGTNRLLTKAENLLGSLHTPELQLKAVLKIAEAYSKLGNIASANDYFSKINSLIAAVTDVNTQAQFRMQVAMSYCEINNVTVAKHWFDSVEPLVSKLTLKTRSDLAKAYAKCNQWQLIPPLFSSAQEQETALYQALTVLLKAGFVTSAIELHKVLHTPIYQALADILIADYSPTIAESLVDTALQMAKIQQPFEQILVLAQAIEHFGRLKNKEQTEKLLIKNKELLVNLPASEEKDALLKVIALHYSHGLQNEHAGFLLTSIQNSQLKTSLNVEISQLAKVRELLK